MALFLGGDFNIWCKFVKHNQKATSRVPIFVALIG